MKKKIEDTNQIEIEVEALQEVGKVGYLGCEMREGGDIRNGVGIRSGKAGASVRNLEKVWKGDGMSLLTKLKLFNSNIL